MAYLESRETNSVFSISIKQLKAVPPTEMKNVENEERKERKL